MTIKDRVRRTTRYVSKLDMKRKIVFLLVLWLTLYGSLIVIDDLVVPAMGGSAIEPIDLSYYRNRTANILDGKIPYRDFPSESPPLIMYLMVAPEVLGGALLTYQIYFSLFPLLTGIAIYLMLRHKDENLSLLAGMMFILSPFAFVEAAFGVQDDMITAFLFLMPLLFMAVKRYYWAGFALAIGTLTKLFDIILFPLVLLKIEDKRARWRMFAIVVIVILLSSLAFLIICPNQFISFPTYYLLGDSHAQTGGPGSTSYWHFLEQGGFTLPGIVGAGMTLAALLGSTIYAYWKKIPFWEACTLVVIVFFAVYPKLGFVYYLMPFGLLMMWAVEDRRVALR